LILPKQNKPTQTQEVKMEMTAAGIINEMKRLECENRKLRREMASSEELHQLYCLIEGLSGVCRDDFDDLESFVDDVNQQIQDDQKQREREKEDLEYENKKLTQQVGVLQRMNKRIKKALEDADAEQTDA